MQKYIMYLHFGPTCVSMEMPSFTIQLFPRAHGSLVQVVSLVLGPHGVTYRSLRKSSRGHVLQCATHNTT